MIFLAEFDVHDGETTSKLYVGTHGIRSGPTDTPPNQYYTPRLLSVGRLERSMFGNGDGVSGGTTSGQSDVGFGNISVLNGTAFNDFEFIDDWKDLAFRKVTIKSLTSEAQSYAQAVTRFVGTIEQLVSTNALEQYDMIIHDRLQDLDQPLLVNQYLGTTVAGGEGTAEGDADMKDQIKQKVWGTVHNVPAIDVNHFDLIWQVSDGPVSAITVYDGGVALTNAGDVGGLAALFATAVDPGSYRTSLALGIFKLGSPAIGSVTADVTEGSTAADRTAGKIAARMVAWFQAMYPESSTELVTSDVTALDAANSAECGILVTDTETALAAIMRVLNSIGGWMLPQSNSTTMFNVGRMDLPASSSVASYDFEDNLGSNPERVESGDDSRGVPAWKVIVRYDQLATVQSPSDLFGVVTENDPIRVQYLGTEWRQASAEDESVLEMWPHAPTITIDSRLVLQADALAEATRRLTIYSESRDIWRITVPMSDNPAADPGIGEAVELTSRRARMGLGTLVGSGTIFRVLGRIDDFDDVPRLILTVMH